MVQLILLDGLADADVESLVQILNTDSLLNTWLNTSADRKISPAAFRQSSFDWQRAHCATTYCIWTDRPVGTISLSRRQGEDTAKIGYWLTSSEWGKGIATEAFMQVLKIALGEGIHQVSANIERKNIASLRIWRRYGAVEQARDGTHMNVVLALDSLKI